MRYIDTEKERENNTANIKSYQFRNLGKECFGVLCTILATSLMVSHYFKIIRQMFHGFPWGWIPTSNLRKKMIRICNNNPLVWISQRPPPFPGSCTDWSKSSRTQEEEARPGSVMSQIMGTCCATRLTSQKLFVSLAFRFFPAQTIYLTKNKKRFNLILRNK